jgi:hypothetical protein
MCCRPASSTFSNDPGAGTARDVINFEPLLDDKTGRGHARAYDTSLADRPKYGARRNTCRPQPILDSVDGAQIIAPARNVNLLPCARLIRFAASKFEEQAFGDDLHVTCRAICQRRSYIEANKL